MWRDAPLFPERSLALEDDNELARWGKSRPQTRRLCPAASYDLKGRLAPGTSRICWRDRSRHAEPETRQASPWVPAKAHDTGDFVEQLRGMNVTQHMAQNDTNRRSAIDGRTMRHKGYAVSQRKRKRGGSVRLDENHITAAETCFLGPERTGWMVTLAPATYNLARMRNLQAVTG